MMCYNAIFPTEISRLSGMLWWVSMVSFQGQPSELKQETSLLWNSLISFTLKELSFTGTESDSLEHHGQIGLLPSATNDGETFEFRFAIRLLEMFQWIYQHKYNVSDHSDAFGSRASPKTCADMFCESLQTAENCYASRPNWILNNVERLGFR